MKTYPHALLLALVGGLGAYIGIAAQRYATAISAIPYGVGVTALIALGGAALVSYRNGQPRR